MATTIDSVNQKIIGSFTGINFLNIIGWIILLLLLVGAGFWLYLSYKNKRLFNKRITAFEIAGGEFTPTIRDTAKVIKLGKGGYEILYLKKLKTWKIAHGGRVGKSDYYFFILPDGYWYNGTLSADISIIDSKKGLIPITTTNPLMRAEYTSLEKQIDSIHGEKPKFWDKYGTYVLSIAFVLIAGVMLWLNYKQYVTATSQLGGAIDKLGDVIAKVGNLAENVNNLNQNIPKGNITPV